MPKITKVDRSQKIEVKAKTRSYDNILGVKSWWKEKTDEARAQQILTTATFLKEAQQYRYRQASVFARLYGNLPLFGWAGTQLSKISTTNQLPIDRPTFNLVQSCVDTLISRISQSRPRPIFLTDNSDYKQRNLGKKLNNFISGELYRMKAHELSKEVLRDAAVLGTGVIKIYEGQDKKIAMDRVLITELLFDPNDSMYGFPRQLYQLKLIDRSVLCEICPDKEKIINGAEQAFPDNSSQSAKSVSDQVMLVEAWHLPSGPEADDGRHAIACTAGSLVDEEFDKKCFPFVFIPYTKRILGFEGQGLAEQLMGTQVEINKLLITTSRAINLVGVPRVFVEDGSKIVKAHLNNDIGSIVTFRGTKPVYEVAPCMPAEVYAQLQRLIDYGYQVSGVSSLSAASKKPEGLDSGKAIREYDDLQADRFADLEQRYDHTFVEEAYQITDLARDIAKRDGKYSTVFPNKNLSQQIDLSSADFLDDSYIIQCHDSSSLPKDPAGRKQDVVDMMQAGLITPQEGRRLLDFPDLDQVETLANAPEERILKILDGIIEDGTYDDQPDPYMDLQLAKTLCTQYYNLYIALGLEEEKILLLTTFSSQVDAVMMAGQPPAPAAAPGMAPPAPEAIGVPQGNPTSDLIPIPTQQVVA